MNNETPKLAARRLAAKNINRGFQPQALHLYSDKDGKELYWRIRLKHPDTGEKWIRPMSLNEQGMFIIKEPKFENKKPLYRLPEIISNLSETIWITEGEWCADHLCRLGLVATTSGGAESTASTDWLPLAKRKIIIWPDNDDAGFKYATEVTEILHSLDCEVLWIDLAQLNLLPKTDCVDWLAAHPNANRKEIESLPLLLPPIEKQNQSIQPQRKHTHTFCTDNYGVWYVDESDKLWICSKLEIKALVRDKASENWGRLLEFQDADGNLHTWSMPMEMLKGSCDELRGELMRLGLEISSQPKMRSWLIQYIMTSKPEARARCVTRTGWYNNLFVMPNQTIGETTEQVLYQSENQSQDYHRSGTLEEWQEQVSALCIGNSRLVLAISIAFAAMLLHPVNMESGGIHFVGPSSSGKTTALRVAASVYGAPNYLHRWRATTNGLEAIAALRCDTLLILDELAQVDAKEAGEIAYMLANGSGKARASRNGSARSRYEWRLLFLSAGEIGLAQHMREVGKKARAGQEVRLVDITADAGVNLGIFESLHNFNSSAELSKALLEATSRYYGVAAIAFLQQLIANLKNIACDIKAFCAEFIQENLPEGASGQVHRVCERFALIAFAGELATTFGITGWPRQEATQAAISCFKAWLDHRGGINDQEKITILSQVRSFFEAHGESRFTEWTDKNSCTINRAGFKKTTDTGTQFYVLSETFRKEICSGLDPRTAASILLNENWLHPDENGHAYRREYLPTLGRTRCYVFTSKVWEG